MLYNSHYIYRTIYIFNEIYTCLFRHSLHQKYTIHDKENNVTLINASITLKGKDIRFYQGYM